MRAACRPVSFYVTGTQGPLAPGEQERAVRWGGRLAALADGNADQAATT